MQRVLTVGRLSAAPRTDLNLDRARRPLSVSMSQGSEVNRDVVAAHAQAIAHEAALKVRWHLEGVIQRAVCGWACVALGRRGGRPSSRRSERQGVLGQVRFAC